MHHMKTETSDGRCEEEGVLFSFLFCKEQTVRCMLRTPTSEATDLQEQNSHFAGAHPQLGFIGPEPQRVSF